MTPTKEPTRTVESEDLSSIYNEQKCASNPVLEAYPMHIQSQTVLSNQSNQSESKKSNDKMDEETTDFFQNLNKLSGYGFFNQSKSASTGNQTDDRSASVSDIDVDIPFIHSRDSTSSASCASSGIFSVILELSISLVCLASAVMPWYS